jgi:aspartyl-tRNA(Asn)/glutamyl-tRNA(Gln) amidotransferase subunit A
MESVDAIVTPTVALSAPAVSELQSVDSYRSSNLLALRNTSIANLLGLCALSIPVGFDALGLPVGLQLMGSPHREAHLLGLGLSVELAVGERSKLGIRN